MDAITQIKSVYIDVPDQVGAFGARGMGEIGFVPLAPAVAAAIHDATGVWFDQLPLKPERIAMGLAEALS
jgi:CO/xanthine dehydrogenase Mo-binding subunit